jgi:2-amino-4-hydroxy-6-hydroxymethyldihydropteridine diphosphokinase
LPELAFIALGSNIEPEKNIPLAIERLAELGKVLAVSQVYQNPAVGPTPQADYLNAAALIECEMPPLKIRAVLRDIEAALGRVRSEDKYAPRTIDLDLCLLGDTFLVDPELKLPDPDLLSRAHLAVTLAELKPDFPHPLTQVPLQAIADRLRCAANLTERPDVRAHITIPPRQRRD